MDERADASLDETAAHVPRPLIPFDSREAVSLPQASKIAGRSESTMRTWCHRYHIGRRIGGVWAVSRVALQMVLEDDPDALALYHRGLRAESEPVAWHYRRLGLGDLLRRRNLAPSDFFHVPAKPRQYRNSVPYLAAHGKCSRSRRLNRPKSS
jgi:hypothetical protein